MKPHTDEPGSVDGGWWPWSTDPATEFPPLITAMAALGLPVQRFSYDLDAWDAVRLGLTVHGTVVRMEGFRTTRPHTVAPVGPDRVRTRLLVIPPATPGDAARAAMRAAAHTGSTATVEDVLEWNTVAARRAGTAALPGRRTVERGRRREMLLYEDEVAS
ncbi:DUF5994 family protein [Saccharothrix luteola]|uniref:DUF5994 family protein n=1 Tax=Saccharothrix luteola TaxID=2893018 RepID=UPI001E4FF5F0|nr:DUF5994 family protein [Saccharothrix luteola]MCC8246650.1 DUF5994 family protein [Saccharothrix luteola]